MITSIEKKREMDAIDVYVGEQIRHYRRIRGMTQKSLAILIGVKSQQVQKYESGQNRVASSKMVLICQALEIDVGEMFGKYSLSKPTIFPRAINVKAGKLMVLYMELDLDDQNCLFHMAQTMTDRNKLN